MHRTVGRHFIPGSARQIRIRELVECLIRRAGHDAEIPLRFTGLQPGEKLNEDFDFLL